MKQFLTFENGISMKKFYVFFFMCSSVKWYTNYHCFHIKGDKERGNVLVCYYSKQEKMYNYEFWMR